MAYWIRLSEKNIIGLFDEPSTENINLLQSMNITTFKDIQLFDSEYGKADLLDFKDKDGYDLVSLLFELLECTEEEQEHLINQIKGSYMSKLDIRNYA